MKTKPASIQQPVPLLANHAVVFCLFILTALPISLVDGADRTGKPNIVLILVDDLGNRSLSCFGGTVPTPNLDQLARGGMIFTNAHAAPMCAPTRDEMFTGLSRARLKGRPGAETPFFSNDLQQLGYTTAMGGKWFAGSVFDPPLRGFDESLVLVNGYRHWAPDVMVFGSSGMLKELNQPPVTGRLNEWEIPLKGDATNRATRFSDRHGEDLSVDFLCDFIERQRNKTFLAYYSSKLTHVPAAPMPDGDPETIELYKAAFDRVRDRKKMGDVEGYVPPESSDMVRWTEINHYVLERFREPIRADELAEVARMHPSSLGRYIKRMTGTTLTESVNQFRIGRACRLLAIDDKPIVEICFECGFQNLSHFNRCFRRSKHCSPSEYRKTLRRVV